MGSLVGAYAESLSGEGPSRGPMLVGLVGKPNVGKSTFFAAATKAPAEIANYPFTTIEPNRGVAYLRSPCPHADFGLDACTPRTGTCEDGTRFVPVEVLDVAGLVPDAHSGKGMGNQFLDNLRPADLLIHVVDATGATDAEGNPVPPGTRDPAEDVAFLENEINFWIANILSKGFDRVARGISAAGGPKLESVLTERLTGLGIADAQVKAALLHVEMPKDVAAWKQEDFLRLATQLRKESKPILLALNKADAATPEQVEALRKLSPVAVPTSANSELALRKAADAGVIRYTPGASDFEVVDDAKLTPPQRKGLDYIRDHVLKPFGSTGVQTLLEKAVYEHLDRLVVYPVEDETHLTDKEGRVLPDAHLMRRGATAKELAYKVHTELGDHFIRAVNARNKRVVGADYELQNGDVIRIVAGK